jgi:hypothetical protein
MVRMPRAHRTSLSARVVRALCVAGAFAAGGALAAGATPAAPATEGAPLTEGARLTEMGRFFDQSEPPSQDLGKARDLYCRAAALGHPEALQRLGWMYFKGRGVPVNEQVAGTLFKWASDLGDQRAFGLAQALPAHAELAPHCLSSLGITHFDALRARHKAANPPAAPVGPVPNAKIDNPVQFRSTPASPDQRRLVDMVVREARAFRLDPRLVLAVMRTESNFDVLAKSPKNAQGLMQLIPDTATRFNVQDPFDPLQNLRGGMAYLRWLLAYYRGDIALTLAAYNAGEGAVDRFRGVPPYTETIAYVQRIRALYPFDRHPFDTKALAGSERSWIGKDVAAAAAAAASPIR